MAPRVTEAEVLAILSFIPTVSPLDPFIEVANCIVNDTCVGTGLSEECLTLIELNLSAHFVVHISQNAQAPGTIKREKVGDAEIEFHRALGTGLDATTYGQTAKLLSQGCLANLDNTAFSFEAYTVKC